MSHPRRCTSWRCIYVYTTLHLCSVLSCIGPTLLYFIISSQNQKHAAFPFDCSYICTSSRKTRVARYVPDIWRLCNPDGVPLRFTFFSVCMPYRLSFSFDHWTSEYSFRNENTCIFFKYLLFIFFVFWCYHKKTKSTLEYIEDLKRVVISYEIYETSLWRVS